MAQLRDKSTYRPNDSMKIELNKIKLSKFVNFTNEPVVR